MLRQKFSMAKQISLCKKLTKESNPLKAKIRLVQHCTAIWAIATSVDEIHLKYVISYRCCSCWWWRISGEWSDDRRSGTGHYYYANGDEYVGEWQNHLRHGQGRYMYASSGLQYEGQWRDGKRTGEGEISRIGGQFKLLYVVHKKRCDVTTFYWIAFASSRPMGILAHMNK